MKQGRRKLKRTLTVTPAALISACKHLRAEKHDPFGVEKNAYAPPGSYLGDLEKHVKGSSVPVSLEALIEDWSSEQTSIYDAFRAFLLALGARNPKPECVGKMVVAEGEVRIVNGDLHVDGSLQNAGTVLVNGNLSVRDRVSCLGDDPTSGRLYVAGSAHAAAFHLMGPVIIENDLKADRVVYARYFADAGGSLWVGGKLGAPIFANGSDREVLIKACKAKRLGARALHKQFPACFDADGYEVDLEAFWIITERIAT